VSSVFEIGVEVRYIERESDPGEGRYVFAYTITIRNRGDHAAQLMSRYSSPERRSATRAPPFSKRR
jgi:uncharacterized protein affecting Mg2+/Co2+ transport